MMQDKYYVQALKQADTQTQSDLDRIGNSQDHQPSCLTCHI